MKLTREEIDGVAFLARLELSDDEKDRLTSHINRLLESFDQLQQLDTTDVDPTSSVIPVYNVFREDRVRPSLPASDVLANGPQVADDCFVVPRVVETD